MNWKILCRLLLLVTLLLAACTAPLLEPAVSTNINPWRAEVMLVRPGGPRGMLVAYDMSSGSQRFTLPPGILSADNKKYYAAAQEATQTRLDAFNPKTGDLTLTFLIQGRWELSSVSPNGRWIALTRLPDEPEQVARQAGGPWQSDFQVLDTQEGRIVHTLQLDGNFEVDTISADGAGLFLIQHLPPVNPEHYLVRLYDLRHQELLPDPLRDKRVVDEVMTGYAWGSVADPQGQWFLTLYINTAHNQAFIHALNTQERFALCIDLPSGEGDFAALQQYSLTLSPDGQTLYAANAALGVVAEISLQDYRIYHLARLTPAPLPLTHQLEPGLNSSLMTADGQILYFSDGRHVWAYDTVSREAGKPLLVETDRVIHGLALSGDGERLYVARAEQPLLVLATATGERLGFPQQTAATP